MYWFTSEKDAVLYVGKAKNLAKRISQYRLGKALGPTKDKLVREAISVSHQVRQSELEALLVEAELIRQYQPRYNILLKDDKSPIYVVITKDEYPRVLTARRRDIEKKVIKGDVYGPFQSAYMLKKVLQTIRPIFRWCNQASRPGRGSSQRPCFYYHLDQCSGACVGAIEKEEYKASITRLREFLRGETKNLQRSLKKEIVQLAQEKKFEEAEARRQEYEAILVITDPAYRLAPDIALPRLRSEFGSQATQMLRTVIAPKLFLGEEWVPRHIECYDVSNFQGKYATVSLVSFRDGVQDSDGYRIFHIRNKDTPDDYGMLRQALKRRQGHPEWGVPDLIVIDGGKGQLAAAHSVWNWPTPLVSIAKRPDRLVMRNAKEEFTLIPISELSVAGELIQQLRDEAHRFAKKHAHKRLDKRDWEALDTVQ